MGYNYCNRNMKDTLILEGKNYISARRAAKLINYSQDYIGQLCRANKLDCRMVGRSWFVTEESLISHRASAVDATDERSSKMLKKNIPVSTVCPIVPTSIVSPIIPITPVSPVLSPIIPVSPIPSPISSLKYESHTGPVLPEIKKRVPEEFNIKNAFNENLNKTILKFYPKKSIQSIKSINSVSSINSNQSILSISPYLTNKFLPLNTILVLLIIASITFSGYILSLSSISKNRDIASANHASIGSFINNLFRNNTPKIDTNTVSKPTTISESISKTESNGVAIVPSTDPSSDENTKTKLKDTFSDEVTVKADKSGTAGVITPVFKKADGDDFLYVLVPVKEEKKQ